MSLRVSMTAEDLRRLSLERFNTAINVFPTKPQTPDNFAVEGRKLCFYITWSKVDGADGYQIAVMTGNDLANPQLLIDVPGKDGLQYTYTIGDNAAARTFSIQSYKDSVSGERLYSEFFYPLATATAKVDGGAADSAPVVPTSAPPTPDTTEFQGDPGGVVTPRIDNIPT